MIPPFLDQTTHLPLYHRVAAFISTCKDLPAKKRAPAVCGRSKINKNEQSLFFLQKIKNKL